jgi:hypothetical protein
MGTIGITDTDSPNKSINCRKPGLKPQEGTWGKGKKEVGSGH